MESLRGSMPEKLFTSLEMDAENEESQMLEDQLRKQPERQNPEAKAPVIPVEAQAEGAESYTIPQLAELLGVPRHHVYDARAAVSSRPGSQSSAVLDAMAARGITWEQVVSLKGGKRKAKPAPTKATVTAPKAPAPAAPTRPAPAPSAPTPEAPTPEAPMPEAPTSDRIEMEMEEERRQAAPALSARNLKDLERDVLSYLSLETLVSEITRRMPRAEIILR